MKVILLRDVPKVGKKNSVQEVADGFAQNFLIARGLGVLATPTALLKLERDSKQAISEGQVQNLLTKKALDTLKDFTLTLKSPANKSGHLFAAIHKKDIVRALEEQGHPGFTASHIQLVKPIKEIGFTEVKLRVGDMSTLLRVLVEST